MIPVSVGIPPVSAVSEETLPLCFRHTICHSLPGSLWGPNRSRGHLSEFSDPLGVGPGQHTGSVPLLEALNQPAFGRELLGMAPIFSPLVAQWSWSPDLFFLGGGGAVDCGCIHYKKWKFLRHGSVKDSHTSNMQEPFFFCKGLVFSNVSRMLK